MNEPMRPRRTHVAVIGAGHSGLCMGMRLKQSGVDGFVILEKAATPGGTWRDNTYPGASCDAPSFLYSFSFAQKTDSGGRLAKVEGVYLPGRDRHPLIEWMGWAAAIATLAGVLLHGTARFVRARLA